MKTIRSFLAVLILATLAGCASPGTDLPTQMWRLQIGMSKDQVVQLLGKPSEAGTLTQSTASGETKPSDVSEVFRYTRTIGNQSRDWIVVFVQGHLTEYGPLSGDLRLKFSPVFFN